MQLLGRRLVQSVKAGCKLFYICREKNGTQMYLRDGMIAWEKDSAAYRAQRVSCVFDRRNDSENSKKWDGWKIGNLRPLFEPILWFMKPYPQGGTLTDNIIEHQIGAFTDIVMNRN